MKTVADFKRRLTVGTQVHTIYHQLFNGRDEKGEVIYKDEDKGVREVSKVQSNSFAFKTTKTDGSIVDSWCNYPKVKECIFVDENTITILCEDYRVRDGNQPMIPILTYKFV